jgi:ketosteroid isomerase-like protein
MSTDYTQMLREAHDSFNKGDIPALFSALDPNITWRVPEVLPFGVTVHGLQELGAFFQNLQPYFSKLSVDSEHLYQVGDYVVDLGHFHGQSSTGKDVDVAFCFLWQLRDGKVINFEEISDAARMLEALK